jgi:3-hydroxyisobutyrate dehydrogenase
LADNPADLVSKVPVVFLNLTDSAAVRSIVSGKNGLVEGGCAGKVVVDTTTNHFDEVLEFHDTLRRHGGAYLETPVVGSTIPASQGNLTVLVSGDRSAYDMALPYLEKIGQHIFYLEKPTLAIKMKLINNLLLGSFMAAIAEGVALGEAAGVDKLKVLDILSAGAGNSGVLAAKKGNLISGDFSPRFSMANMYKDLHYVQDLASALKRPVFSGSLAKEVFGLSLLKGLEKMDFSAVYEVLKEG